MLCGTIALLSLVAAGCGGSADGQGGEASQETAQSIPVSEPGARATATLELAGNDVAVTIVLPDSYAPGEPHPILLAFPPGGQAQAQVDAGLDAYWADEARVRGWIVISPAAPEGALFFQGSEAIVPELLDKIAATYPPEGGVFHVSGVSNGGLSAFRAAVESPERFASIVVLPGFPPTDEDADKLELVAGIPVHLYVGETDTQWVEGAERTRDALVELGGDVTLTVEPGGGHILRGLTGAELFDVLETARVR